MWKHKRWLLAATLLFLTGLPGLAPQRTAQAQAPNLTPVAEALAQEPITLSLQYRGLTPEAERGYLSSFWGFGQSTNPVDTPFIQGIDPEGDSLVYVQNSRLGEAMWSALRYRDDEPVAFYIDLNGDGELSDDEILTPTQQEAWGTTVWNFVTPDFLLTMPDGVKAPYRYLVRAQFTGSTYPNIMWAPLAVWEGTFELDDQAYRVTLMDANLDGDFQQFGTDRFSVIAEDGTMGTNTQTLSRLIAIGDQFARVEFQNRPTSTDEPLEVTLTRDTAAQGTFHVTMEGLTDSAVELPHLRLVGADEPEIQFALQSSTGVRLPALPYRLMSASLSLTRNEETWETALSNGPRFTVSESQPARIALGDPELKVTSRLEQDRYNPTIEDNQTTCKVGDVIYLSRVVAGNQGETYGRISMRSPDGFQYFAPQVAIQNSQGDTIATGTMEYG